MAEFDAPIEAVWQSWTSKAGIEAFFAPEAEIDPRVGGAFHIHMDPLAPPGAARQLWGPQRASPLQRSRR